MMRKERYMTNMVKKDSRTCTRVVVVTLLIHFQGTIFVCCFSSLLCEQGICMNCAILHSINHLRGQGFRMDDDSHVVI